MVITYLENDITFAGFWSRGSRLLYSVVDLLHFSHISRVYCSFVHRAVVELGDGALMSFQSIQNL